MIQFGLSAQVLTMFWLTAIVSCGSSESAKQPGDSSTPSPSPTSAEGCPDLAVASFATNVQPAIDLSCSKCHATHASLVLKSGSTSANRDALFGYSGTSTTKLTSKIHGGLHQGGNQSANLPLSNIQKWIEAEIACAK
jgi:hypothetical protein